MALFPWLPGWAGTRKVKQNQSGFYWSKSGSGISWAICKSAPCSRQITMPAPNHSVFYRPDVLPAAQPRVLISLQRIYFCCLPSVLWHCWLGIRKGIRPVKNWLVGCWCGYLSGVRCRLADVHMAQLMPLPLTVSCFSKIQIGFTFLVPAHPGSHRKRAVKRVCLLLAVRAEGLGVQVGVWCWPADVDGVSTEVQCTQDEKVCLLCWQIWSIIDTYCAEQGLCNARVSVCVSVHMSVPSDNCRSSMFAAGRPVLSNWTNAFSHDGMVICMQQLKNVGTIVPRFAPLQKILQAPMLAVLIIGPLHWPRFYANICMCLLFVYH